MESQGLNYKFMKNVGHNFANTDLLLQMEERTFAYDCVIYVCFIIIIGMCLGINVGKCRLK